MSRPSPSPSERRGEVEGRGRQGCERQGDRGGAEGGGDKDREEKGQRSKEKFRESAGLRR